MRNLGRIHRLVPATWLLVCAGGCVAGAPSGDPQRAEATASSREAIVAAGTSTSYRHVKGVRQAPGRAGAPPTDAACRSQIPFPCYSPQEMQTSYGVSTLLGDGFDGKGQTIVIVDSFGSPTIAADLKQFDADYGLQDPPSFEVLAPLGTVPFDPTNSDMVGWAFETTLDVEWAHAMAPGAKIVLLTSPVTETEGVQGLPEFLALETYALDHHLGNVLSQSWGATENTLLDAAGQKVIAGFEKLYARARAEHVTVLASAGDNGSSNQEIDATTFYPSPTVIYPASSPQVSAVGGTSLSADVNGTYQSEVVWNNDTGAGGGGVSQVFVEPAWQRLLPRATQGLLGGHRAIPDVAYNADPDTGILVYLSWPGFEAGYYFIGGTSEGAPQWAGIVADFNELAGHPLGSLNGKLYLLGALGLLGDVAHDITVGNNGFNGVAGYAANAGWDPATGWGTPKLTKLGELLAAVPDDDKGE